MTLSAKLKSRGRIGLWVIAGALIAAGGIAAISFHAAQAKNEGKIERVKDKPSRLGEIESILRDEKKDASRRVEEALKVLEEARDAGAATPPWPDDLFADSWAPLVAPFAGDKWEPFQELNRMRQAMDRLFNDSLARLKVGAPDLPLKDLLTWSPEGEFEEKADKYVYRFDLPGVGKDDVTITVENGRLIIEGRRETRAEESDHDKGIFRREIQHGRFRRVIALPGDVDVGGAIESSLKDGVLTVLLPKVKDSTPSRAKTIAIQ